MVFVHDEGSVFDAPLEEVWKFLGSPGAHEHAHRHRAVRRTPLGEEAGEYSGEQDWDGRPTRFTMQWRSFHPLGIAYRVVEGPFEGSAFFLYYTPLGPRTAVTIVGDFRSSSIPSNEVADSVDRFFALEFEQDHAGIRGRSSE
jgi:hypothetical protein